MDAAPASYSPLEAYEQVMRFAQKRGEAALRLALHAAVPQSFRFDLLHLIKRNFVPEAGDDAITEVDVLLAPFCQDIGRGYFQFDSQVRLLLLDNLAENYAGETVPRISRVANLLIFYADSLSRISAGSHDVLRQNYLATQRWTALAFADPENAARQFAAALAAADDAKQIVARIRLGGLAASLSTPLSKYLNLLNYADALQTLETEGHARAEDLYGDSFDEEITVGSVSLRPLSAIIGERNSTETDISDAPPTKTTFDAKAETDEVIEDNSSSLSSKSPRVSTIYLICYQADIQASEPLRDYLFSKRFEVIRTTPDSDENSKRHDELLNYAADAFIIFCDAAPLEWLRKRIGETQKLESRRYDAFLAEAIYLTLPASKRLADFSPRGDIIVIKSPGKFAPSQMQLFINKINRAFPTMKKTKK